MNMNGKSKLLQKIPQNMIAILLFLAVLAGTFYWFEYRPTQIRQGCSWVKRHEDAVPERPALTEEQLWSKGLLIKCTSETNPKTESAICNLINKSNKDTIQEYKQPSPAKPAKGWFVMATDDEYESCIRSKGLTR